jgi:hypothetical protein
VTQYDSTIDLAGGSAPTGPADDKAAVKNITFRRNDINDQ